jgi:hypothetical protein
MTSPHFSLSEAGLRFLRHLKEQQRNWFLAHKTGTRNPLKSIEELVRVLALKFPKVGRLKPPLEACIVS